MSMPTSSPVAEPPHPWLRRYTKLVVLSTLMLIFIGGLVTSHGAGLAVPDWPTTYGENMFTYPIAKWQGGILYEHGHRLFASFVGLLIVILAFWQLYGDRRPSVKALGFVALLLVVLQGVLGGVSVLMRLKWGTPEPVWFATLVFHGVLAQSFLVLTVLLAYLQSKERRARLATAEPPAPSPVRRWAMAVAGLILVQLVVGAAMRHRGAGLALMDFPTSAGYWVPTFSQAMLERANEMRATYASQIGIDFAPVTLGQMLIHFAHRFMGVIVAAATLVLAVKALRSTPAQSRLAKGVMLLAGLVVLQFTLGVVAVLSHKEPLLTSIHVAVGALTLAASVLVVLRSLPLSEASEAEPARQAALKTASAS